MIITLLGTYLFKMYVIILSMLKFNENKCYAILNKNVGKY